VTLSLADFLGEWNFRRLIADPDGRETGRAEGVLRFVPDEGGLAAEEQGVLRLQDGTVLNGARRTLWRQEAGRLCLYFADGRPFHDFDPALEKPGARHDCPPDLYDVAYDFTAFPRWRSTWRVTGPRKDYVMSTDHARRLA
jgi:hypothetical protein